MAARMTISSPRLSAPRVVAFESWDDRSGKRSFIRILSPPKDAGAAFLKLHPNLWSYVPRVERTLRNTIITTFGRDLAVANTESTRPGSDVIGRQSQTWVRMPEGWRIVAAHVSDQPVEG